MPTVWQKYAKVGKSITSYSRKGGIPIAYSLGGKIYMNYDASDVRSAKSLRDDMYGLNNFSIDRLAFKIAVARALWKDGITPTLSAVANLVMRHNR